MAIVIEIGNLNVLDVVAGCKGGCRRKAATPIAIQHYDLGTAEIAFFKPDHEVGLAVPVEIAERRDVADVPRAALASRLGPCDVGEAGCESRRCQRR